MSKTTYEHHQAGLTELRNAGDEVVVQSRHGRFRGQLSSDQDGEWWYVGSFGFEVDDVSSIDLTDRFITADD